MIDFNKIGDKMKKELNLEIMGVMCCNYLLCDVSCYKIHFNIGKEIYVFPKMLCNKSNDDLYAFEQFNWENPLEKSKMVVINANHLKLIYPIFNEEFDSHFNGKYNEYLNDEIRSLKMKIPNDW